MNKKGHTDTGADNTFYFFVCKTHTGFSLQAGGLIHLIKNGSVFHVDLVHKVNLMLVGILFLVKVKLIVV